MENVHKGRQRVINLTGREVSITDDDLNAYVVDHFKCPFVAAIQRLVPGAEVITSAAFVIVNGMSFALPGSATGLWNDIYVTPNWKRVKPLKFKLGEWI